MNQTLLTGMPWRPSHATDVTATWRKHGWKPASEIKPVQSKQYGDDYDLVQRHDWLDKGFKK